MQSKNWKCVQDVNTINKVLREVRFRAVKRVLVVRFCSCCFFVRRRLVGRHVDTNADDEKSCNKSHCNETKRVVFNRLDYLKNYFDSKNIFFTIRKNIVRKLIWFPFSLEIITRDDTSNTRRQIPILKDKAFSPVRVNFRDFCFSKSAQIENSLSIFHFFQHVSVQTLQKYNLSRKKWWITSEAVTSSYFEKSAEHVIWSGVREIFTFSGSCITFNVPSSTSFVSFPETATHETIVLKLRYIFYYTKKIVPRRTREEYPDWSKLSVCWLLEEGWSILFLKNLLFLFKKAATIFLEFNRKLGRISWRILAARSDVDRIGGDGNHVVFICYSSAPRAWDFKSCDVRCSFWWFNDDVRLRIAH